MFYFKNVFLLASIIQLSGCSLNSQSLILENNRDLSGQFDGKWSLEAATGIGNCNENFVRTYMEVRNGVGNIGPIGPDGTGYISRDGEFLIHVPEDYNKTRRKYGGNLVNATGRVVMMYSGINNTNCTVGLRITRTE